jgi:phosphohistidine swiveling domain-containing protein
VAPEGVIALDGLVAAGRDEIGGKGWQLGRLHEAGLLVPDTRAIPVRVFRGLLWRTGLLPLAEQVERDSRKALELRDALLNVPLPDDLCERWIAAARALGGRLAVRSSGVDEDGATRSFAGQHKTVLDVAPEDVPSAVRACWASLYDQVALTYRGGRGPAPGALAVLLQRLLEPSCAGVMFTVNPTNGSWREMVVEAVWGLGEGLVSGQVAPHWFLVRRPSAMSSTAGLLPSVLRGRLRARLPGSSVVRRVAERVQLQLVEQDLPEQLEWFVASGRGVVKAPTPRALRATPTLDPPSVRKLCRLGLRVERALGEPQDIEWAREHDGTFRILQARPITSSGTPRETSVLWTRRFMGERWPEPATPLGWSILAPVLEWLIAYPETQSRLLGGGPPLKLIAGRPYVNATVFRHLAFKLPGSPPPRFMLELVPPDEEQAWRRRFAVAPDLAVYASILRTTLRERRWQRFRWNPFTNHLEWARFQDQLEAELPRLSAPLATPEQAVERVEQHVEWIRRYVSIHVCSLLFANISWQLLEVALASWVPERRAELMERLATCPPGNLTLETNTALHALAKAASEQDLAALSALQPTSEAFGQALDAFLERFGHRSEASWEIMSPRWQRHPERLVPLLRASRDRSQEQEAPEVRAARQEARHKEALDELRSLLSGPRLTLAELCVHYARRYLLLRENQRFWFDKLLFSLQQTLLWLGHGLTERQILADAEEVELLTWPELRDLVQSGADTPQPAVARRLVERRAQRVADAIVDPPTFLHDDEPTQVSEESRRLEGLGISPGRVRGRVRVVRSLTEGHKLQQGEVLVTRAIDPGWTPLFTTASAVVLEMGSVLSHGAVVAREYGLPAVVNIERATQRLQDGQEITVDGNRGVVWVHGIEAP